MLCSHEGRSSARNRPPLQAKRQAAPARTHAHALAPSAAKPGYARDFRTLARSPRSRQRQR